jgi:hypothetical protein
MIATILVRVPLALLPVLALPAPTANCQLEVIPPVAIEAQALVHFYTGIERYVVLHRRLERALPPEGLFDDPEDMSGAIEALGAAIRDARPNVRAGNIFSPAVAEVLRNRLHLALFAQKDEGAAVLAALKNARLPGMPEPRVNEAFEWPTAAMAPPSLLRELPGLPHELEYRFVGFALVLIDTHANLVVDVLNAAVTAD